MECLERCSRPNALSPKSAAYKGGLCALHDLATAYSGGDSVAIAKRSVKEMRRQTFESKDSREIKLAAWYTQMSEIFPDVGTGNSIIGVYLPGKGTQFWQGHRKLGEISDVDFSRRFFEIWLGSMTSAPELRAALLGVLE